MSNTKVVELAKYYSTHFPAFSHDLLQIKLEAGGYGNLEFNETQYKLDAILNDQLSHEGKVRALVLKPRREGISTYVAARFFHQICFRDGVNAFILAHKQEATDTLFEIVQTYYSRMPDQLKPKAANDSAKSLKFEATSNKYSLGTARGTDVGRSQLAHFFHGSEVAMWHKAEEIAASVLEIVGDQPKTEIILESTGLPNTYFAELWDKAEQGKSGFKPIFFPFFESTRNEADATGVIPTTEESELLKTYPGYSLRNLAFRRLKLGVYSEAKFNREYPCCPADAFSADDKDAFITPTIVQKARNRENRLFTSAKRILGVDPSQTQGGDPTGMVVRQGDKITDLAEFNRENVLERADVIANYMRVKGIAHTFIDQGGSGKEIYDILVSWGVKRSTLTLVPFGARASNSKLYPNKRNEMYGEARTWLDQEGDIPKNAQFVAELSVTREKLNANGQYVLESKKDMRRSPNLADAFVLTFAYPVANHNYNQNKLPSTYR